MSADGWRQLVDLDRLRGWMDACGLEAGPIVDPTALAGGTQNVLVRFRRGDRHFVLRRPPSHPYMDGSATMRREARVLSALADTDVPHPRLIRACSTDDILGAAFYLMEPVDGFNANVGLPELHANSSAVRHDMGIALAGGLAALARVDHLAAGLGDLGKTDGFLERQAARWRSQLEKYAAYEGWPGPAWLPGVEEIDGWLRENRPADSQPGILHGDYHLSNVMFRRDGPELAAIVDWELTTIGDPLVDLGWMLATWPDSSGQTLGAVGAVPWDGFPTAAELVERYALGSRRDLGAIRWYAVLGCYKLGILQEGTYARAFAGKARMEQGERLHRATVGLFERALGWIESTTPFV
jgi:aminoglycoside phosphotransferase (APT) family kinase protein